LALEDFASFEKMSYVVRTVSAARDVAGFRGRRAELAQAVAF
jgi:hypothetical protein